MKTFLIAALAALMWPVQRLVAQSEVPVEVVSYTLRQSSTGFVYVVGEVRNTYKEPLCFVQVDITYLDDKGNPVGVDRFTAKDAGTMAMDQVMAARGVIPPGEIAPFSRPRDMSKIKGTVASCKVTAKGLRLKDGAMGGLPLVVSKSPKKGCTSVSEAPSPPLVKRVVKILKLSP
jgi:hypothetical protein